MNIGYIKVPPKFAAGVWEVLQPTLLFYWLLVVLELWVPGFVKSYLPLRSWEGWVLGLMVLWVISVASQATGKAASRS